MAIKPPSWCSRAVPTTRGWKHWATSEILLNKSFTQEQIDEFYGVTTKAEPEVVAVPEEAPSELDAMSKRELEALGREHGVELDRRSSKKVLVDQMKDILNV
jgi:hypothetical protein